MKTLIEIIEAVKSGKKPEYDELRYAVCTLESLGTLDHATIRSLIKIAENKEIANMIYAKYYERQRSALNKTPKEYLGKEYDPDNPDYQKRRKACIALFNKLVESS